MARARRATRQGAPASAKPFEMAKGMKQPVKHYLIDFASRYSGVRINTLNASAAIWRAESLVQDAQSLSDLKSNAEGREIYFGNVRRTYEIIDYFAVGFLTFLESPAPSRLVHVMLFPPSRI